MIVKFCGKKTPLVRRKRRHRRSVHHEAGETDERTQSGDQEATSGQDSVQVHPAVIEVSLPFGKKVRLGEKKKSTSTGNGGSGGHHRRRHLSGGDDLERSAASSRVLESVARATRLAGNLGQRIANIPNGDSTETNPIAASEESSSSTTSPSKEKRTSRSRGIRSGVGIINTKRRPFKSLSPEKRLLAKGLAETVSRSFEKLDLVSPRRIVERKRRKAEGQGQSLGQGQSQAQERSASADADSRRKKRKERKESKVAAAAGAAAAAAPSHGKEVTIAKLGKFTFSLEVNSGAKKVPEMSEQEKEERRRRRERRKKSKEEHLRRKVKPEEEAAKVEKKETVEQQLPKKPEPEIETKIRRPSLVVVSKRQKSDRPLRSSVSPEKRASAVTASVDESDDFVDYRMMFGQRRPKSSKQDSFSRSISHPGPPPNVAEIIIAGLESNPDGIKRNNSFAGDKSRPDKSSSSKLKRSETEKSVGLEWSKRLGAVSSANSGALLLSPRPAFENRAYDKSPEPKAASKNETQKSESLTYLKTVSDSSSQGSRQGQRRTRPSLLSMKSSSLDAPASAANKNNFEIDFDSDSSLSSNLSDSKRLSPPTQVQSLSEESNSGDRRHFDDDISSSDSEMEIVVLSQKSCPSKGVSRSKIIERVVKKESIPETQSRALLLASSLSSSSISSGPSEDGDKRRKCSNVVADAASNVDFIFPGEESSPSSKSPSLQQTSLSVSSLSERYSRKDSASSTTSSLASPPLKTTSSSQKASKSQSTKAKTDDLDNISIMTDGMG